jgi:hypothetical protein
MATTEPVHEPQPWYYEAGSDKCPHGPKPSDASTDEEYDAWWDRHRPADECTICLDAPMGDVCPTCSADCGEAVPWSACSARSHAQPKPGTTPTPGAHEPVEVWVGTTECLDRECEELYDDEGDEIPGKERCSHIGVELVCGGCSTRHPDGYYEPAVPWTGPHTTPAARPAA